MDTLDQVSHSTKPSIAISTGEEVSIQLPGGNRIATRLLGKSSNQYLVLRGNRGSLDGLNLNYGDTLVLRYLHAGVVYAFRSFVLNMVMSPERLLFVSYPRTDVQQHALRQAERVTCSLPCSLSVAARNTLALMVDLSETGCQCIAPFDEGAADEVTPGDLETLAIQLRLPDIDGSGEVTLTGIVRRVEPADGRLRLGVQFEQAQPVFFTSVSRLLLLAGSAERE